MVPKSDALCVTGGGMSEIERIEKLAAWNRAEGNTAAAQHLEALATSMRAMKEAA